MESIKNKIKCFEWFEHHPAKSIILYTVTISFLTWGIYSFLYDDRSENLHKTELKLLILKLDSNRVVENQLKTRIEFLEKENSKIVQQNQKYYSWLSNSPGTVVFFENEINKLNAQLVQSEQIIQNLSGNDSLKEGEQIPKYSNFSERLEHGNAFLDTKTGASFCVNSVEVLHTASGYFSFPDNQQGEFNNVRPGKSWTFMFEEKKYMIYLSTIDYPTQTYKVVLKEE